MESIKVEIGMRYEQARIDYVRAQERYGTLYVVRSLLDKEIDKAETQMEQARVAWVNAGLDEVEENGNKNRE
jgi:hypothetical protein